MPPFLKSESAQSCFQPNNKQLLENYSRDKYISTSPSLASAYSQDKQDVIQKNLLE